MGKTKPFAVYDKSQIVQLLRQAYGNTYFISIRPDELEGQDVAYLKVLIRTMAHSHNMTLLARRRLLEKLYDMTCKYQFALKKLEYLQMGKSAKSKYQNLHLVNNKMVKHADNVLRLEMMKKIKEAKG